MLVVLLVAGAGFFHRPLFRNNFGVVDPGRVFRSAQPGADLDDTIRRYRLGAIVNLRGGSESDAFYRDEALAAERLGVEFYDLALSATQRPSRRELMLAMSVLDRCRYPLLIHCKSGADRTGMLSALYRMEILGEPPERAMGAFSMTYNHFPIFGPERLHEPFEEYARWLADGGLRHDPDRFRRWVETEYRAEDPFTGWPEILPGRRVRVAESSPRRARP